MTHPVCQCLVSPKGKLLWEKTVPCDPETLRCRECGGQAWEGSDETAKWRRDMRRATERFAHSLRKTLDEDIAKVLKP